MSENMEIQDAGTKELAITEKMKKSFMGYAMSVIVSRALPDVRDGLKPVHRRILHAMNELGMTPDKPHKKSARIVGDVIGKYHPHGDSSVYEAMVRMAQWWSMGATLIDGHGNFGSMDGDPAAAMRYTEAKLSKIAMELLRDIGKDTVDFAPNYDGEETEPTVVPSRYPNLLVNGAEGIAVGMATKIPPHNLKEVCDAGIAQIDNPDITIEELMEFVKGPDFPTGGQIMGSEGSHKAYSTGRGSIVVRGKATIEESKKETRIVITELPYQVNKEEFVEKLKGIQLDYNEWKTDRDKRGPKAGDERGMDYVTGSGIRDESDRNNPVRVVIELKKSAQPLVVLNYLYKHTKLQSNFPMNNLAIVPKKGKDGKTVLEPQVLTLKETLAHYIKHQLQVVRRAHEYDLKKKELEMKRLEAVIRALDKLDETIATIRESKSGSEAENNLMALLSIDREQAKWVLEKNLRTLANSEQDKERKNHRECEKEIERLKKILADESEIRRIIKKDLREIADKFGEERKSEVMPEAEELDAKALIPDLDMVVTVTRKGYIKRTLQSVYRSQRRNGRGVSGADTKGDDFVEHLHLAKNHDTLMFFTNFGMVYRLNVHEIPELNRNAEGILATRLLRLDKDERIQAIQAVSAFSEKQYLFFATKNGMAKKTPLSDYANIRKNGIAAITLNTGDSLIGVELTSGDKDVTLVTKHAMSITFSETDVKSAGRTAKGVIGIDLADGDEVISLDIHQEDADLFIATSSGYGKRTPLSEFRKQTRGGKGVLCSKLTDKNGYVLGSEIVQAADALMLITNNGTLIKLLVDEISQFGRNTQGTKIINLRGGDMLSAIARIADADNAEDEGGEE